MTGKSPILHGDPLGRRAVTIKERLDAYERLMRLDQPIGALLLLWPAMWALWLAKYGVPDPDLMLIFIFGVLGLILVVTNKKK